LRSVDYRDADRIVTLLTARHGKLAFIARGARRSKKRFGGALQPFAVLGVEVTLRGSQLGTLLRAEVSRAFPTLLGDLDRLAVGYAMLELLAELSPERQADAGIFALALEALAALDAAELSPLPLLLAFELRLVALAGFAPNLQSCGGCGKRPGPEQAALFDPRRGHLVCRDCGGARERLSARARGALGAALAQDWKPLLLADWAGPGELTSLRQAIERFVEHRIGKSLKSLPWSPSEAQANEEPCDEG